jgi:hypothetical protein
VVAGRITDEDLPDVVLAIRRVMGWQGVVARDLGNFQWRACDPMGGRYIIIHVEGERTLIRALGNFRGGPRRSPRRRRRPCAASRGRTREAEQMIGTVDDER